MVVCLLPTSTNYVERPRNEPFGSQKRYLVKFRPLHASDNIYVNHWNYFRFAIEDYIVSLFCS